ncbi:PASTA domain-containing protein [Micromonospora sp. NPDC051006]|uniref:PASTA domain-containing protein n=1 Tax=Micromonospora sp. NPDC051006 TaxID=3364283 RepID=UPI00379CCCBC
MSDDRQQPPTGEPDDDQTRPLPRDDAEPADLTQRLPAERAGSNESGGKPPEPGAPEATAPLGRPVDRTAALPPERAAPWSGRAEVPPPRPADYREQTGDWYAEDQGGRRWWLPILWGVLTLLLVALLGTALWLVLNADDDRPGPEPSPSPVLTTAVRTSAAPTSAAPTSEAPSSAPPTTEAAGVPVPPVTGLPQATAEALLDGLGLSYRVEFRPSELPPGRVIGTEPGAGELVSEDDEVVLLVSQAESSETVEPPTPSPTGTATP